MEDIVLISIGVVVLLLLMFAVFKFLMREQSYDKVIEQKKQELETAATEQKPGKQKRRHVYSKHNDKSKLTDDKPKFTDEKHLADDKQKSADDKQKSPDHKQKSADDKQKSPDHKQKSADDKQKSPDHKQKSADDKQKSPDHKQKSADDKQKSPDHKHKSADDKQKSPDHKQKSADDKQKSPDHKQKSIDDKQKSPDHKQKSQEEKVAKSDTASKVTKSGGASSLDASSRASPSPSKKHVEIKAKVETIDPDADLQPQRSATPELILSSLPSRSILVNKDEKSLLLEIENVPETFHPRSAPVDELDKKYQEGKCRLSGTVLVADVECLKQKTEGSVTPSPPTGKSSQKKKKKGKVVESGSDLEGKVTIVSVSQAVERDQLIETADLARGDPKDAVSGMVKMLENGEIEEEDYKTLKKALESKAFNVVSSSKKKNDEDYSTEVLKKQVRDLEISLQKEKLALASADVLVKQLREQLALELQKSENLKKSQQSQAAKQLQEISDLRTRLEMKAKTHEQERSQLQIRLDSLQSQVVEQSRVVQALMEENRKLKSTAETSFEKETKKKTSLLRGPYDDNIDASLEDNIKQFEDQFEEMVAKQEMEKMKEDNETLVHSLRSQIAELNAEILEKNNKIDPHSDGIESVNEPVVCENVCLTGQHNVSTNNSSCFDAQDDIVANGIGQFSTGQTTFHEEKIRELEELLKKQRQKNDDLRQKNWKVMEALSETERELQKANHAKGISGTPENVEHLVTQLHVVQREKGDLERSNQDQEKLLISLQHQITDLQKQIDNKGSKKIIALGLSHGTNLTDHETEIMKLEESLNRQIQKNDDLRRRNWKTMEALSDMERQLQHSLQLQSDLDLRSSEVNHLKDQLRSVEKDKVDLEILNKGLSANLATCVHQVEQAEKRSSDALTQLKKVTNDYDALKVAKTSTDGLNDSQLKRISQLETFIGEKNTRIKQLEEELLAAQKSVANDFSGPVSLGSADSVIQTRAGNQSSAVSSSSDTRELNRKDVMVVTRVQETAKWDVSQLVLELDTKSAEVEILQSLLEQNENSLHDLQEEKSKTLESVHHMQQALKEKDVAIQLLQVQLKSCSASEASGNEFEKVLAEQKSLQEQVKHYQNVLAETAGMLRNLQQSVEKEESKWHEKVAEADERTAQALQEAKQLRDELEVLRSAS